MATRFNFKARISDAVHEHDSLYCAIRLFALFWLIFYSQDFCAVLSSFPLLQDTEMPEHVSSYPRTR